MPPPDVLMHGHAKELDMEHDIEAAVRDPRRLHALRNTGLLDTEVEEQFDRLTRLASRLLGVPATFFSLVDEERDYYKACFGFPEPLSSDRQLSGTTFCHYSLVSDGALVIPDTRADPVYREVPTVESLGVGAYLGVPVRAPGGEVLGSFCAIDFEPRDWSPLEVDTMVELARSAEREVAIRDWMRRQRQLMEQQIQAHEELQQVMDSRARLMRGFTHDVKNPLGAADGFLALMQEGVVGSLSPEQLESIKRARRSMSTALSLIDDLLQIARAESGQLDISIMRVDLGTIAREAAEEYRAQAEARGLDLECRSAPDLPPIESDPARIRQVLSNLISNAVKYTEQGGVVVATDRRARKHAPDESEWGVVDVRDTGPGIADRDLGTLFDEFTRLHGAETPGTGLGLAIAQRLAEALDGMLTVESELGRGSTFTLWLAPTQTTG